MSGPDISSGERGVTLHEEEVVNRQARPAEGRVRLEKDVVTDDKPVDADLREGAFDVAVDADLRRRG